MKAEEYTKNGWTPELDAKKPWGSVWFRLTTKEQKLWDDQVKDPARDVATGLLHMGQVIQGDDPLSSGAAHSGSHNHAPGVQRSEVLPIYARKRQLVEPNPTTHSNKQPRLAPTESPPAPL